MKTWTMTRYLHALSWWRSKGNGTGSFNEDLYRKFIEIRYGINNLDELNINKQCKQATEKTNFQYKNL